MVIQGYRSVDMERLERMLQEQSARNAPAGTSKRHKELEAKASEEDAEMVNDSVPEQILTDYKAKNYFACLGLPKPDCDDVGRPVWEVADT